MLDILTKGGPVMIPLMLCSVIALAVGLERLVFLWRGRIDTDELMEDIKLALQQGKVLEAVHIAKNSRGPVASILAAGISYYDRDNEEIKERLTSVAQQEVYKMERRMPTLDAVIGMAPLLGLLGTVTGIIKSFRVLAALEGIQQPSALSVGIAEALITTAVGLIIAIPTIALYYYLSGVIERQVADMERRSAELLNLLQFREGK